MLFEVKKSYKSLPKISFYWEKDISYISVIKEEFVWAVRYPVNALIMNYELNVSACLPEAHNSNIYRSAHAVQTALPTHTCNLVHF